LEDSGLEPLTLFLQSSRLERLRFVIPIYFDC